MSDTYDVGDWRIPTLTVAQGDDTTTATVTVVNPSTGATTVLAATSSEGGKTWEAPAYELVVAGDWIERWVVTGAGAGKQRSVVSVAPDPGDTPAGVRVYATTTDYANHLRAACPPGARLALARASAVVDGMLLTAIYDTDDDGLPTDAKVIAALREATCLQAQDARAAKAAAAGSFSIGSVSVTRSAPQTVREEDYRSPRALAVLQRAGLTGHAPWSW